MNFNKKQIKEIIQQEIEWHTKNKDKAEKSEDWVKGFIQGLRQIKEVFNKIK